jgi:rubrerythrin
VALVSADSTGDIQMLQTAAAIENLAIKVYTAAAGLPPGVSGAANPVVLKFVQTTIAQHADHGKAFNAAAAQLGGKPQTGILQSVYDSVVTPALAKIKGPADVVALAITLEDAAAQTYVKFGAAVDDAQAQKTFATVAPVEAQHVAVLLAVKALLDGGAPELIALPPDLTKLPGPAGSVGFPKNFYPVTGAVAGDAGAVK